MSCLLCSYAFIPNIPSAAITLYWPLPSQTHRPRTDHILTTYSSHADQKLSKHCLTVLTIPTPYWSHEVPTTYRISSNERFSSARYLKCPLPLPPILSQIRSSRVFITESRYVPFVLQLLHLVAKRNYFLREIITFTVFWNFSSCKHNVVCKVFFSDLHRRCVAVFFSLLREISFYSPNSQSFLSPSKTKNLGIKWGTGTILHERLLLPFPFQKGQSVGRLFEEIRYQSHINHILVIHWPKTAHTLSSYQPYRNHIPTTLPESGSSASLCVQSVFLAQIAVF